ncbi:Serine/threonine-protein phosphatase 4 regulatory subunit 1 [Linnemannia hyalina]|uniref:Serine/threonine-protein phosphatase 4 regulatory subunit 1 n=1 Tax=Linnemannia hyalina TaxID=64524 RepID=A0A9P7XTT7_9FUNG|nr:Serine/threonine-protein phosphatase 4 regulatory subunit 1 [Linnemannia hyalina]
MEQEVHEVLGEPDDKERLDYLVVPEVDDTYDPLDGDIPNLENADPAPPRAHLEFGENVEKVFADEQIPLFEQIRLQFESTYDAHRSRLTANILQYLSQMQISDAISTVIPVLQGLSADAKDSIREVLASQLDKIVLHFFQHARIRTDEETPAELSVTVQGQDTITTQELADPSTLPHNVFTPIFINLLLDQNAGIAHQTRQAVVTVAENISEDLLEKEILNGIVDGLERLYEATGEGSPHAQEDAHDPFSADNNEEQDGEAELGKMLVVVLLTSLANALGKARCTEFVLPKLEKLVTHSQFYVRKEIVLALGTLCKVVDQDVVVNKMLPLFDLFVRDDSWEIRRACCTILGTFSSTLPLDLRISKVEEIYDIYAGDVSRNVRNSAMEVLGEVIYGLGQGNVPDTLLNHFLSMGQQPMNEHELAVMCAFSFPAVVLTAGRSKWPQMKPVYMKLAGTFRFPIRRSLACSLHEVAKILGPELADRDLATAFSECLVAEDEVKEGVIGHVVEFVTCLSPKKRSEALRNLNTAWLELEQSSNWRLRDSLAGQLPGLCEIAEGQDLVEVLIPLSIRACTDSVSTIRESGVMAFPALWDASTRIGPYDPRALSSEVADVSEQEEEDGPVPGCFGEGEDVEMEDLTAQLNGPTDTTLEAMPSGTFAEALESASSTFASTITKASAAVANAPSPPATVPDQDDADRTTTIQSQVVRQTVEFATTGGFRSRVVAVQIIQSLLDSGMTVEDFEEYFLVILIERLATDTVVNVRIWVSRVVTWIIDSGFYNDAPESNRLQGLLTTMQHDPDRDVRIYAGGPAELPKPKKKKRSSKSKGKSKKKKNGPFGASSDRSLVGTIAEGDEDADGDEEMQIPADEKGSDEDEDDDEEEGETDSEEDESSDDNLDFLNSAKAKGISNKPRNRNSIGLGMKVMVNNKLTVSGKEIRKPKTSWDYIHGEIDDDEEDGSGDGTHKSFSASLGSKEALERNWDEDEADDGEGVSLFDAPRQFDEGEGEGDFDAPRQFGEGEDESLSLFDAPRRFSDGYSDEDDDEDTFVKKLQAFRASTDSTSAAVTSTATPTIESTATTKTDSPMEVAMEEAVQDGSDERVAVVVSGSNDNALAGQEPSHDGGRPVSDAELTKEHELVLPAPVTTPAVSQYPPLSPATAPSAQAVALTSQVQAPSTLSYAALVKKEETGSCHSPKKVLVPMGGNRGAVTVDAAQSATRNGTSSSTATGRSPEEQVLRVLNAKLQATGTLGKKAVPPPLSPINTALSTTTDANGTKRALAYKDPGSPSYAAIVASGATSPHPGRLTFSPFSPMTTSAP